MNPQPLFCLNLACSSRGLQNAGNIIVHDSLRDRFRCKTCGHTFSASKGTLFYRLRTDPKIVICVLTLLACGCPLPAIVRAFGFDERTVTNWQHKAGQHCEAVHTHLVTGHARDLQQVQADEVRVKLQARLVIWMAMAICVPSRLWLGGVLSPHRDKRLIVRLVAVVKACAQHAPLLLMSDGLSSYVPAWCHAFREAVRTGKVGRPRLQTWPHLVIGQVVKQYERGRVIGVAQRLIHGTVDQLQGLQPDEHKLNTAYIERLNATFRQRLCCLTRRGRCLVRHEATLQAGMYLLGCVYNFCTFHKSLRQEQGKGSGKWQQRTPAMAAGITQECWSVTDLFAYRVPPAPFVARKRRGRPPGSGKKTAQTSAQA